MIEVLNDYSEPIPPPGFVRALKLISPKLSLMWHKKVKRWMIVTKDVPRSAFRDGYVVEHIVSRNGRFAPLNEDVLDFLRKARWERDHFSRKYSLGALDHHLQEIERDHQKKSDEARSRNIEGFQEFAKKAVKFNTVKTFI